MVRLREPVIGWLGDMASTPCTFDMGRVGIVLTAPRKIALIKFEDGKPGDLAYVAPEQVDVLGKED